MRLLPSLLALAVASGAALAVVPSGVVSAHQSGGATAEVGAVDPAAGGLSVDVIPRQDGILAAGGDLTVALRLSNDSDSAIPVGTASVFLARTPTESRGRLDAWLLGGGDPAADGDGPDDAGPAILQLDTPTITAGGSVVLPDTVVPAATLPFVADSAGVYLLSVTVSVGDGAPVIGHSAVTVRGGVSPPAVRLALAMPIALPPAESGIISADDLASYTSTGGLLDRQLSEASAQPVTIGIDPRIIVSIRVLGDSAPASALAWLERLRTVPNDTFALGYADTDISATSQAAGVVLAPTSFTVDESLFPGGADGEGEPAATPSPTAPTAPVVPSLTELLSWDYSIPGVAWPRDGTVVGTDLETFAASALPTTIVSSTNTTTDPDDALAASGSTAAHRTATSDDTLSRLLREAVAAPTLAEWQADVARLSAALSAASGAGDPSADRIMLATLGRAVPTAEFRLSATIAELTGSGSAVTASFSDAVAQTPTDVTILDSPVAPERSAALSGMFASEASVAQFATVLDDPTPLTGERRLSLMALASQSWIAEPEGWENEVAGYSTRSNDILSSVVVASTNLVQTSDRNPLPIVVTNALDYPVTVTVEVVALRPIVDIQDPSVDLTIPANSQKRASIAAESIANGEVRLSISLFSKTRVPISAPSLIEVTVNAGWETTATSVLGVVVVAVFILGIVRTVRRRRRIAKGEVEDDRSLDVRDLGDSATGSRDG